MASLCCHGNCHLPAGELEQGVTQWGGGTVPAGPVLGTVVASAVFPSGTLQLWLWFYIGV